MALYEGYKAVGMTLERFQSRSHVRIKQIQHLTDNGDLNDTLRWAKVN